MIGILKVGNVTQMRVEASKFQKHTCHTADSLVCPLSYDHLPTHSFQLTGYSKSSPSAFKGLILIPGYKTGAFCKDQSGD